MALTASGAEVTLGITTTLAPSIAIFGSLSAFTAMGWFYTGSTATAKNIFYVGEDETPFGGNSYVWLGTAADGATLTLEVFDGTTLFTYGGLVMAPDTWYAWAYVKGAVANRHDVYTAGDVTSPGYVLSIQQTKVDNIGAVAGIFTFVSTTTRRAMLKMWSAARAVGDLNLNRTKWIDALGAGTLRHNSPLRFPGDLYNYSVFTGGVAFNDPVLAAGYRTHMTNIGGNGLVVADDPVTLLAARCITSLWTFPFSISEDVGDIVMADQTPIDPPADMLPAGQIGLGVWIDRTQFRMDPSTASGWPAGVTLQTVRPWITGGRFTNGPSSTGTTSPGQHIETCSAVSGTFRSYSSVGVPIGDEVLLTYRDGVLGNNVKSSAMDSVTQSYGVDGDLWRDLYDATCRARIFAYYWGWISNWPAPNPGPPPDGFIYRTYTHTHTELGLILEYDGAPANPVIGPLVWVEWPRRVS